MRRLVHTSLFYTILGLLGGIFYREFTKYNDFQGDTMLSVVHTHALVLGAVMFLLILLLEKNFQLMKTKEFNIFYIVYNLGLLITVGMQVTRGIMTVLGKDGGAAISGVAGVGHGLLGLGFVMLFVMLYGVTKEEKSERVD